MLFDNVRSEHHRLQSTTQTRPFPSGRYQAANPVKLIVEFGKSRFEVEHRLLKDEQLCVEGFETRVWVGRHPDDPKRIKSKPIPEEIVKLFGAPVREKA